MARGAQRRRGDLTDAEDRQAIEALAADTERIYVADILTHSVKVYSKTGIFVTKISQRGTAKGRLLGPDGIIVDKGRLYVMEEGNERISIFNLRAS